MKVAFFSTEKYDRRFFDEANTHFGHELVYLEPHLNMHTVALARDFPAVCAFVNDNLNAEVIAELARYGTQLIALRSAGFNHVDIQAAQDHGLTVVRVPAYSPYAVAEHTIGLLLTINRKFHRAYNRVREGNFALEGLLGFDIHGLTVGIIGTGKIGMCVAHILRGFGCKLLAYDIYHNPEAADLGIDYVSQDALFAQSDIITLHCPLTPETYHLIDQNTLAKMKNGVVLLNTSRGGLVNTMDVIEALKSGKVGYLGLDVYEEEADLFFEDLSSTVIQDDIFARLLTFPNVVITGHQAFFTHNALYAISETTLANITAFEQTGTCEHTVTVEMVR